MLLDRENVELNNLRLLKKQGREQSQVIDSLPTEILSGFQYELQKRGTRQNGDTVNLMLATCTTAIVATVEDAINLAARLELPS